MVKTCVLILANGLKKLKCLIQSKSIAAKNMAFKATRLDIRLTFFFINACFIRELYFEC